MTDEELRANFAPLPACGERLPENGRMPEGSFYTLRISGLSFLFLYSGGERRLVATLPTVVKSLPAAEGLPELARVVLNAGTGIGEWMVIDGKWIKL